MRFAVVLYGGASLAIYMYGIAEEFLHLVRSTAPAERAAEAGVAGELALPEPESTEAVYRKLGQLLPFGPALDAATAGAHALRRRRHLGHLGRRHQRRLPGEGARQRHARSPG